MARFVVRVMSARGYMLHHRFVDVHRLLAELREKLDIMGEHLRKTYYDTRIQVSYRDADDYCQSLDYGKGVK